jgi:nanoRNase/pAp phosphatase (c-di-AMP/oligoRNAs hydrolase)
MSSYLQIEELLKKSKKILLVTRQSPSEDSLASLLAFGFFLEKMGKEIDMVTPGPLLPTLSFLPKSSSVRDNLSASRNFIISLDTSQVGVSQLSYDFDKDGNRLNIYVTPKNGVFKPEFIETQSSNFGYEAIIILDCQSLENLGGLYEKNTALFYETPIINIDCHSSNEQYGEVNLVNSRMVCCAEILYNLFENINKSFIDESIATSLLVGLVAATKSFQSPITTPQTFNTAAKLIALGADQQKIVRSIFKNKSLSALQLWGRAFARVQHDPAAKLTWTLITLSDFEKTKAAYRDLQGIEEELSTFLTDSEIVLVLLEKEANKIEGLVKVHNENLKNLLAEKLSAARQNGFLKLELSGRDLIEAEKEVVLKIKEARNDSLVRGSPQFK